MKKLLKWAAITLALCGTCHAQLMNGNQLYGWMSTNSGQTVALAYITGVTDSASWQPGKMAYCLPPGGNNGQFADVVKKYLADNPQERHKDAPEIIFRALLRAFPCGG